eukprot:6191314-Pleurochrysis_carterae.AAC.1
MASGSASMRLAGALRISRRAFCALLVQLGPALGMQLLAGLGPPGLHGLLEALPSHPAQLLLLLLAQLAPAHERCSAVSLAEDGTRARIVAAFPCARVVIAPKGKHALSTDARHRHDTHARAHLGGDLLGSADAAWKKTQPHGCASKSSLLRRQQRASARRLAIQRPSRGCRR